LNHENILRTFFNPLISKRLKDQFRRRYAADAFQAAAKQWNDIGFGVNISAAPDKACANFLLQMLQAEQGR